MDAGTRLTVDQLAALAPGDAVTIESRSDVGRIRRTVGTVSRVTDTKAFVRVVSARGVPYVQEFSLVTGWRTGRTGNAALVDADATDPGTDDRRQEMQRLQRLWRAWTRNPESVELLRALHEALGERLGLVRG